MTQEEHEKWERYYLEAIERDMLRQIYKEEDEKDAREGKWSALEIEELRRIYKEEDARVVQEGK